MNGVAGLWGLHDVTGWQAVAAGRDDGRAVSNVRAADYREDCSRE
jgi:hypothetical protein